MLWLRIFTTASAIAFSRVENERLGSGRVHRLVARAKSSRSSRESSLEYGDGSNDKGSLNVLEADDLSGEEVNLVPTVLGKHYDEELVETPIDVIRNGVKKASSAKGNKSKRSTKKEKTKHKIRTKEKRRERGSQSKRADTKPKRTKRSKGKNPKKTRSPAPRKSITELLEDRFNSESKFTREPTTLPRMVVAGVVEQNMARYQSKSGQRYHPEGAVVRFPLIVNKQEKPKISQGKKHRIVFEEEPLPFERRPSHLPNL
jgi:hypothetical protein